MVIINSISRKLDQSENCTMPLSKSFLCKNCISLWNYLVHLVLPTCQKLTCMYSWSSQWMVMSSHPGLPMKNVWCMGWFKFLHIVKKACRAKQEWSTDAYSSPFVTIHYTLFDFVVGKHPNNIESNHQRSDIVEKCISGDRQFCFQWHM